MNQIFNFSPGPAILPHEVLQQVKKELLNWHNLHVSVMEISHRSTYFMKLINVLKDDFRELMNIPENYDILFCQGGARTQFAAIPMNLLDYHEHAEYIHTGFWSDKAIEEAKKYCIPYIINVRGKKKKIHYIKPITEWNLFNQTKYIHLCPNETIEGIAINEDIKINNKIIIADLSSYILTKKIKIKNYGLIYASAQKNIGPSGLTFIIIRKDLLTNNTYYKRKELPSALNYNIIAQHNSMFNTPPTFSLYITSLVLKWLKTQGMTKIYSINQQKASIIYNVIDQSNIYNNNINPQNRSLTNIVFTLPNIHLEQLFLKYTKKEGLLFLKGHSAIGGIRVSIYNAMPLEGIQKLEYCMNTFEKLYT
ncbi:3-phosphoserine/phosphohydroxythreonine transaminase [Enterobacteriaceae endosymbiont of Macroplea mutica]|uniref:3-phosphoserine/phosphohydroxythreonine transaminase n=1 Tax=Enterobacteriaceae endosymbiont of Macroplea mutica TaxID=2675791 RepID=UPI001449467D|nr:3-phosphoserine/phosphohydroxythreonine transaminase [Enterobacteriaceae endosymbiont of Macroplea mutica]QJC31312.1 3-phosphoserine/phosphohydroxythreonine transaminase [Enterobacteriaceae endosymbiont of Macroplea mutica]